MKVKYFKEQMSGVQALLLGWRSVTSETLNSRNWVDFLRFAAKHLLDLADELERDITKEGE